MGITYEGQFVVFSYQPLRLKSSFKTDCYISVAAYFGQTIFFGMISDPKGKQQYLLKSVQLRDIYNGEKNWITKTRTFAEDYCMEEEHKGEINKIDIN